MALGSWKQLVSQACIVPFEVFRIVLEFFAFFPFFFPAENEA